MSSPDFVCVGAQKAGTTTLYSLLSQHPEVFLPEDKEVKFFNHDPNWNRGKSFYLSNFSDQSKVTGDITPDYMCYDFVPERIFSTLGKNVKIIFMLRDPVLRGYSQFNHFRRLGVEHQDNYEKLISDYNVYSNMNERKSWDYPTYYLERGFYLKQINNYLKYFDISNMYFVKFEDFVGGSRQNVMSDLCRFINVSDFCFDYSVHSNEGFIKKSPLVCFFDRHSRLKNIIKNLCSKKFFLFFKKRYSSKLYQRPEKLSLNLKKEIFNKYYLQEIDELELLTGLDLSSWR